MEIEKKLSRRDVNKTKVLNQALKSFIEKGIADSKISDIAEDVCLSERSAFRYFDTKADLVLQTALLFWDYTSKSIKEKYYQKFNEEKTGIELIYFVLKQYADLYFTNSKELLFIGEAETYLNRIGKQYLVNNKPPLPLDKDGGPLAYAIHKGLKDGSVNSSKDIQTLYYNSYDSLLGLMQNMAINDASLSKEEAEVRLDSFCKLLTDSYR